MCWSSIKKKKKNTRVGHHIPLFWRKSHYIPRMKNSHIYVKIIKHYGDNKLLQSFSGTI